MNLEANEKKKVFLKEKVFKGESLVQNLSSDQHLIYNPEQRQFCLSWRF